MYLCFGPFVVRKSGSGKPADEAGTTIEVGEEDSLLLWSAKRILYY